MKDKFLYVSYIKTTQEKLWDALTKPEFTKQYFFGVVMECDWKAGAPWKMVHPDGRITDAGKILEIEKPKRLVIHWVHAMRPELKDEGPTRCTITLEPAGDLVKLTVLHESELEISQVIQAVSGGWPKILSSLKSLLETGTALPETNFPPKAAC